MTALSRPALGQRAPRIVGTALGLAILGCGGPMPVASPPRTTRPAIAVRVEWATPQALTVIGPHADRRVSDITGARGYLVSSRGDTLRLEVLELTGRGVRDVRVAAGSQLLVVLGPDVELSQEVYERPRERPEIPPRPPTRGEWGKTGLTVAAVVAVGALVYIGIRELIEGMLEGL